MTSKLEKGGGSFTGIKLLLCENPLPPLDEAIEAARAELPRSNHYTEARSAPLRRLLTERLDVPESLIHIHGTLGIRPRPEPRPAAQRHDRCGTGC